MPPEEEKVFAHTRFRDPRGSAAACYRHALGTRSPWPPWLLLLFATRRWPSSPSSDSSMSSRFQLGRVNVLLADHMHTRSGDHNKLSFSGSFVDAAGSTHSSAGPVLKFHGVGTSLMRNFDIYFSKRWSFLFPDTCLM